MTLYRLATDLGAPFIDFYLKRRLSQGREDSARFAERKGVASLPRPDGDIVWVHAASVGEAMSVLSLVKALRARFPTWSVLLTTGTVTSAKMLASRLPEGVFHQYVPVDRMPFVRRFLDHWKPNLALWVESELWPNTLAELKARDIPALLLNGRMSDKSFGLWRRAPSWAREVLSTFPLGLAQTPEDQARYVALGMKDVRCVGNLKYAAEALPADMDELVKLRGEIGARKAWLMASTHSGEDEIAIRTHQKLKERWPDILTIIAPRHPVRAPAIEALIAKEGLTSARRAARAPLRPETDIYLADTMGEMGLLYRLCPIVGLAGSFTWGGHNPIEPALLGRAIVFGPRMINFDAIAKEILAEGAAIQVPDRPAFVAAMTKLFDEPALCSKMEADARFWAMKKQGILDATIREIEPFFKTKTPAQSSAPAA